MKVFMPYLKEEQLRLYVVSEAKALGMGDKLLIKKELGISNNTINKGLSELESYPVPKPFNLQFHAWQPLYSFARHNISHSLTFL
jgi:hypothetical protein